jgi:hypothetical protein
MSVSRTEGWVPVGQLVMDPQIKQQTFMSAALGWAGGRGVQPAAEPMGNPHQQ